MTVLRVSLFGKFDAQRDGQALTGLDSRRVQELFCYLLLYRDRPHPREALANVLWDENDTDRPNRCLRKTLWQLRAALNSPDESLGEGVLRVEPDWVEIDPGAGLWLDVAVFEEAFERAQGIRGRELDDQHVEELRQAVNLYGGGLQESWYQDWYLYERERFQNMYLITLDKLMGHCEAHRHYEYGVAYGRLILRCESARERTHRRLMRLHCLAGDRTAALHQYERCVSALDQELAIRPAARTASLYQQIRADQFANTPPLPVVAAKPSGTAAAPLAEALAHLRQLQSALAGVQRQVCQDIQAVEQALNGQS
jgi:DNA-binding SARP family transcriptional activator